MDVSDASEENSSRKLGENKVCNYANQKFRSFLTVLRRTTSYCASGDEASFDDLFVVNRKFSTGFSYKLHKHDKSPVKSLWPIHCREFIFLPVFPVLNHELDEHFNIVRFIAKGSFGSVYQVTRRKDSQTFALKVSEKSKILLEDCVDQLKSEASIHQTISHHPFVVTSFNHWQNKGFVYNLLEFLETGELLQRVRKFTGQLIKVYVAELALVLDFLHNAGIIYRDLKSENILLDANFHIKLTDFGLSKWLKLGQRTSTICGTRSSMAPEIFTGEGYSHAVDWYALGVLAYRMMTINMAEDQVYRNTNQMIDDFSNFDAACNGDDNRANETAASKARTQSADNDDDISQMIEHLEVDKASRDLLVRLLERSPQHRLKSLLALKRVAFFHNFNFDDIRHMKISPRKLIENDEDAM